jgi:hypothetical protein
MGIVVKPALTALPWRFLGERDESIQTAFADLRYFSPGVPESPTYPRISTHIGRNRQRLWLLGKRLQIGIFRLAARPIVGLIVVQAVAGSNPVAHP